ncbi:hypothetical protein [Neosynechococcus sphagnicola]|uniref:hypothetical protein n=1 Tax=Neosynechococcus sphagnicola TaxID=1501145 RepID=UPI00138E249F|nr:hypothetical protein [Neosynechococcus sphagnicola]
MKLMYFFITSVGKLIDSNKLKLLDINFGELPDPRSQAHYSQPSNGGADFYTQSFV